MFVDAFAIVAILTREPEADVLAELLDAARGPITSPIALWNGVVGVMQLGNGGKSILLDQR